jgi:predicted P-loop ATPase
MNDNVSSVPLGIDDFDKDDNGKVRAKSQKNIILALRLLGVRLSYDEFSDRILISGLARFTFLNDPAIIRLWLQIDEQFKFLPPKDFFFDILLDLARSNTFHPVRDYLNGLEWDGVGRIDDWLIRYAGAKDTPYIRAVGRLMLTAAIRRVRQPGCKFDEMVVLEGPQGNLKSTLLKTIAVRDEWFSDDLPLSADSKKLIEQFRGRWIVEASELTGMRKTDHDHLKSMLSRTHDRSRLSYERVVTEMPRHNIIVGTTNDAKYFRDQTGNRRYWPVAVGDIKIDDLKQDIDQLWAEAAILEAKGESIRLDKSLWPEAAREQIERLEEEPWKDILDEVLGDMEGKIRKRDVREIIGRPSGQFTTLDNKRLKYAMESLGWKDDKQRFDTSPERCWTKGSGRRAIKVRIETADAKRVPIAKYDLEVEEGSPLEDDESL